jgi:pyruvate dehydrogenase E2 component (dihydrolipoamide acetyltransferase)
MLQRRRNRVIASPRARRAMRARGMDPASVRGSGPGGRIVEADVIATAETFGRTSAGSGDPRKARAGHVSNVPLAMSTLETCSTFRLQAAADVTSVLEIQRQIAEEVQRTCGTPPRLADFMLRAMALALVDCPTANCAWQGETCAAMPTADVGFEVNLPGARLLPVIFKADRLRLLELISRRGELTVAAQQGRLPPGCPGQAATALCDLSGYSIDRYSAVLFPPQTSVLAVGRPMMTPGLSGPEKGTGPFCRKGPKGAMHKMDLSPFPGLRQSLCLTLTADQRALSPETAAAFLGQIVELLERPFLLLCERLPR